MRWIEVQKNPKTVSYIDFENVDYFEIEDWSDHLCELTLYKDGMPKKITLPKSEWERIKNKIYA